MVEKRKPITVGEAVERVMALVKEGTTEQVHIEQAFGRTLAADIIATHPVPPFDRSPYDGFAIRAEDSKGATRENPVTFSVTETIGAGFVSSKKVEAFQAARIMTGAKLPDECDAVVMFELTSEETVNGKAKMTIKRAFQPGDNVSFKGEDTEEGTVLVEKGTVITPGVTAVLATFGYEFVEVARKPVIGVFATGTELLDVNEELQPGKIRNSNAYMTAAQITRSGAEVKILGKLEDDLESCYHSIHDALSDVDMLITTGGVSVGDFDLLPAVYERLGAEVLFNKIAMRPGSVTTAAHLDGKLLFGLSGNPSACYVGFELLVRPVVRFLQFDSKPHLLKVKATLAEDFTKPNPFTRFVRSKLFYEEAGLLAAPNGFNKSNAVTSLAGTDCLITLPGGTRGYTQGDQVDVLLLEASEGSKWPW
ncbi:gephyrin-like molybdotransferase Glp [Jeotgalibacillus proteolyticus]|uniref:Molybdopterin molybdenumtransferase n=1 Tax=Jeotgalibacillus proteolyticus TaxID=2082395 RepID=A0A2S5GCS9_9BACL|nr:gephyrin-like molybdotransferase Glp [Jeotgalibacillus proteolyticus]PPA70714.1 molybdopterin molybdenumtransferase [Jeotgalibacillus proteolyticus]